MASRQFVIIGLGNSANYLARHLTSLGHDIMVIDSHPEKIHLNLKELGVKHIIAKSSSAEHTSILEKLGVTDIFHPERDAAISLAERLNRPNMVDFLPFMEGYSIVEIVCPKNFIGKTLKTLSLTHKYGVQVIAIRDPQEPTPKIGNIADVILQEDDVLFIIGPNEAPPLSGHLHLRPRTCRTVRTYRARSPAR